MRIASSVAAAIVLAAPLASAQTVDRSETRAMVSWINHARADGHAAALTQSAALDVMAEAHSMDMATHRFFSHQSPNTGSVADRARAARIEYRMLAENIAIDSSPRTAFDALMRSPGHHANIMDPRLRSVGIGIVRSGRSIYVTQVFATLLQDDATPAATVGAPTPATPPSSPAATAPSVGTAAPPIAQDADEDDAPAPSAANPVPAPTTPMTPTVPGQSQPMPGMPWLTEFLTPWMAQMQPLQPGRPAPQQAPRARRGSSQPRTWVMQTPLGPMRITVSGDGVDPNQVVPGLTAPQPRTHAAPAHPHVPQGSAPPQTMPVPAPSSAPLAPPDYSGMF